MKKLHSLSLMLGIAFSMVGCAPDFKQCMEELPNETDEQAYLQIGGPFDQLKHKTGEKMTKKIDRLIRNKICAEKTGGLTLGIVWQGNLVYIKGYGWATGMLGDADSQARTAVRGQRTRFRWASVSKTLTGLASSIADQEVYPDGSKFYNLDGPIGNYIACPGGLQNCEYNLNRNYYLNWTNETSTTPLAWPKNTQAVPQNFFYTPRMFLSCRSGMMHYGEYDPSMSSGWPSTQQIDSNDGFIWAINQATSNPMLFLPGTRYNYSSYGFNIAGAALDTAARSIGGYEGYLKSRIFNKTSPVAMKYIHPDQINNPLYSADPWNTQANRAEGYWLDSTDGEVKAVQSLESVHWKLPSGGFISTGADMALYMEGLLNYRFLSKTRSDEMWTPQGGPNLTSGYAIGFNVGVRNGERVVAHNGGQEAASSRMVFYPDGLDPSVGKLGIVVMSASEHFDQGDFTAEVEALLRDPFVPEPLDPLSVLDDMGSPVITAASQVDDRGNVVQYADFDQDYLRESSFVPPRGHTYNFELDRTINEESPDRAD